MKTSLSVLLAGALMFGAALSAFGESRHSARSADHASSSHRSRSSTHHRSSGSRHNTNSGSRSRSNIPK